MCLIFSFRASPKGDQALGELVGRDRIQQIEFVDPGERRLARLSQFLTRNPRKWLILRPRYSANGLRLSPQIDFDRGKFGVVVAQVKTGRDDGGLVELAPLVE
jgi:hypothetical protein